jgi:hypothetical protein
MLGAAADLVSLIGFVGIMEESTISSEALFFFPCVFFFPTRKYGFPVKFPEKQSNKTAKQQVGHGMALSNSFSTRG